MSAAMDSCFSFVMHYEHSTANKQAQIPTQNNKLK